jgi:NRPS condensation-like uncharacterized protein
MTEYLVALYMHCLIEIGKVHGRKPRAKEPAIVRIEVPVDMRRFYPTETMRNFSLFVSPEVDPGLGLYGFDEIVQRVHHSLRMQIDRRELARQISRNVRVARHPLIRALPLVLKDLLFNSVRRRFGERTYSGVLSNLGPIKVPAELEPHIAAFGVMLGPNPRMKTNCAILSYRDDLLINFGSVIASSDLERRFFTHLVREGVPVAISERISVP